MPLENADVDAYGLPLSTFGDHPPKAFFELVGRIVAVNGRIEYLRARLDHLPPSETTGIKKVEQFLERDKAGRLDRNAIVHSSWIFGANTSDPGVILGIRYKARARTSGATATLSLSDLPESDKENDYVQHDLASLRGLLKRDLATMQVGRLRTRRSCSPGPETKTAGPLTLLDKRATASR
jgi:hypothetical protein